jgi:RimJ/RimL family protein N-acetyltransferase
MTFLETPHLYLRPLAPSDADGPYLRWFNDTEVCRYNSHHTFPYLREDALAYIEQSRRSRSDLILAIVQRSDDRHIGNIALENIDPLHRSAEFAIVIGERDCWGKGYSKEAAAALIHHGFCELNLRRIYCGTLVNNIPMQKLAQFLGMEREGLRRQAVFKGGSFVDVVEYGLLQADYFRKYGPSSGTTSSQ